jgi:tetratricopeptide (TPR) repeat protein
MVLLLAVAGLAVSTALVGRHSLRAQENLDLALTSLEKTLAESVAGNLIVEKREPKRAELARQGIAFYEEFARKNDVDPQTWPTYRMLLCNERHTLAKALHTMGKLEAAEAAYKDAVQQASALVNSHADEPRHQARLAYCLANYAQLLGQTKRVQQAADHYKAAEAIASKLVQQSPASAEYEFVLGQILYNRGTTYALGGELSRAETAFRAATPPLERAINHDPGNELCRYVLAQCRYNLGQALGGQRDVSQRLLENAPDGWRSLAEAFGISGESDEARRVWEQALADWRSLAREFPRDSEYVSRVGATLSNLAVLARDCADFRESRALAEQALDAQKRARAIKPPYEHCDQFLATHYKVLSQSLVELQDEKALAVISEERIKLLPDFCSEYCGAARSLALCAELLHKSQATTEDAQRRFEAHCGRALEILADARAKFDSEDDYVSIAQAYMNIGNSFNNAGRQESARQAWQVARDMFARFPNHELLFDPDSIAEQIQDLDETLQENMDSTKPAESGSTKS